MFLFIFISVIMFYKILLHENLLEFDELARLYEFLGVLYSGLRF